MLKLPMPWSSNIPKRYKWNVINADLFLQTLINIWDKVCKNGPSKICARQTLKNLKFYGLSQQIILLWIFKTCLPKSFNWFILEYFAQFLSNFLTSYSVTLKLMTHLDCFILSEYIFKIHLYQTCLKSCL